MHIYMVHKMDILNKLAIKGQIIFHKEIRNREMKKKR